MLVSALPRSPLLVVAAATEGLRGVEARLTLAQTRSSGATRSLSLWGACATGAQNTLFGKMQIDVHLKKLIIRNFFYCLKVQQALYAQDFKEENKIG